MKIMTTDYNNTNSDILDLLSPKHVSNLSDGEYMLSFNNQDPNGTFTVEIIKREIEDPDILMHDLPSESPTVASKYEDYSNTENVGTKGKNMYDDTEDQIKYNKKKLIFAKLVTVASNVTECRVNTLDIENESMVTNISFYKEKLNNEGCNTVQYDCSNNQCEENKDKKILRCNLCNARYKYRISLQNHILSVHDNNKTNQCTKCPKAFNTRHSLRQHIFTVHTDPSHWRHVCSICNKRFSKKGNMTLHLKSAHSAKSRRKKINLKNVCLRCNKQFDSITELTKHKTEKHPRKKYPCEKCGFMCFSNQLASHYRTHSDIRQYQCELCGATFRHPSSVKQHFLSFHENQRAYKCSQCPKSFNTKNLLRSHIFVVHTDPVKWKHVCPVCNKHFPYNAIKLEHIKVHEKDDDKYDTNYTCKLCLEAFSSNYDLENHAKTCSIDVYPCKLCTKLFRTESGLNKHLNKHKTKEIKISK